MRLKGKVAVVAGAGTGVGRAAAILFADEGAKVAVISRRKEVLEETVARILERGGKAIHVVADLAKAEEAEKALEKVAATYGSLDVLHCNTGTYSTAEASSMTESLWESMFEANLKAGFLTARAAIPHFLKSGKGGSIILTAAVSGHLLTTKNMAHYNASKAGVVALTKSLALELASHRVRVNCVCPGEISHKLHTQGAGALRTNPELLRNGLPEDIAFALLYFASEESSWVTGSTLVVDGGLSVGVAPGPIPQP